MRVTGIALIVIGTLGGCASLVEDTTVSSGSGGRVHNIGLIADRQNHLILSGFAFLAGAVFLGFGQVAASRRAPVEAVGVLCPGCGAPLPGHPVSCPRCHADLVWHNGRVFTATQVENAREAATQRDVERRQREEAWDRQVREWRQRRQLGLHRTYLASVAFLCWIPTKLDRAICIAAGEGNKIVYRFLQAFVYVGVPATIVLTLWHGMSHTASATISASTGVPPSAPLLSHAVAAAAAPSAFSAPSLPEVGPSGFRATPARPYTLEEQGFELVGRLDPPGTRELTFFVSDPEQKPIRLFCERLKKTFAEGSTPAVVKARFYDDRAATPNIAKLPKFPVGDEPHLVAEYFYDPRDHSSFRVFHGRLNPEESFLAPEKRSGVAGVNHDTDEKTDAEKALEARILDRNADAPPLARDLPRSANMLKGIPHPPSKDRAARKKFGGVLKNARTLAEAKLVAAARKDLERIITGAPGTAIAAEAQKELDALPAR
jgi:hypothetical protein